MGEDVVIRGRIQMDRSVRGSIRMDNAIRGNTREILTEVVGYDFDDTPTEGSENPVTSDGIYRALQPKADRTEVPTKVSELENDSGFITDYTETDPTVPAWAKEPAKPTYTAQEVGALPDNTTIPSKTSQLQNDAGFISQETDPTVPSWAKAADKPSYTASEVGALPDTTTIPSKTSELQNDSDFIKLCYAECSTAGGTVQKEVSIPNVTALTTGLTIVVKFANANSVASPTLKVNSLDAKAIKRYGTTAPSTSAASSWNAGAVVALTYDGTYWQLHDWNNTTYSAMTSAEAQAGTSTSSRLITPARLKEGVEAHAPVQSVNSKTGAVTVEEVPAGGTAGQVLSKKTNADGDTEWTTPASIPTNVSSFNNDAGYLTLSTLPVYNGGVNP